MSLEHTIPGGLRIIQLNAENVKRLRLVEIRPKANVLEVTGANGSGKSSLLDAILYALGGTRNMPTQPVRDAERGNEKDEPLRIKLDLGDLVITRETSSDGETNKLIVESDKGARYKAPQQILDALLGSLTFDPLEFAEGMDAKTQLEVLRQLVPLEIDIDALDGANIRDFDTRTGVGREWRALEARVEAYHVGVDWPTEPQDTKQLLREMQAAGEHNANIERIEANRGADFDKATRFRAESIRMREDAARMIEAADLRDREANVIEQFLGSADAAIPARIDVTELRASIEGAERWNEKYRLRTEAAGLQRESDRKKAEHEDLTERIEARRAQRATAIANAKMPVDGLGFGEGEVTFKGKPFNQASDAERLRVSLAIAMAQNAKLRVIRIKQGSLLDSHAMEIIREMAADKDYQVWIERVDETGKVGIYLEAGAIVAVDESMAEALI